MTIQLQRPQMKTQQAKITDEDWQYFSLGIDKQEFVLPSQRQDYTSDPRAVALVEAVKNGQDLTGKDFSGVNLKGADISGGNFQGANFSGAIFYNTTAKNCHFEQANFDGAYWENFDASGSYFTDASFHHIFVKNITIEDAEIDEKELAKLSALEYLIYLIESGQIDIKSLSQADLMHLDLRRLDLSKVDLSGVDLSMLVLEGVNLCGTYIDPKQLMSLAGLEHYHCSVQKMKEKKLKLETLRVIQAKNNDLNRYAQEQAQLKKQKSETPRNKLKRPLPKGNKSPEEIKKKIEQQGVTEQPSAYERHLKTQPLKRKKINIKNRT